MDDPITILERYKTNISTYASHQPITVQEFVVLANAILYLYEQNRTLIIAAALSDEDMEKELEIRYGKILKVD